MSTKPAENLTVSADAVDKAARLLKEGGLVAMPTETVYGLAADATNGEAVARIYAKKSRPQFNPLIVHVDHADIAAKYVEWNAMADKLAVFWPGPITLVLKRRVDSPISELVSAGGDTIALRMPKHPLALELLAKFGGGLAAPSANRSGRVSPTTAQHVRDEFTDGSVFILDGGPCHIGIESTVVDCTGEKPVILRPGFITADEVALVAGRVEERQSTALRSPGMLESHYAPSIPVRMDATDLREGEALLAFGPPLAGAKVLNNLSESGDLVEAAANLFAHLRALDTLANRGIAVMPIPNEGIGAAINDRLRRASVRAI